MLMCCRGIFMSSLLLLAAVALVTILVNLSLATNGNDPQNLSPDDSRLQQRLSPDAVRLQREFSVRFSLYPDRPERNVLSEAGYLQWPLVREVSRLKRKILSDLGRLKRDVSSGPSHLKRDASSDPSNLKREISSDPSHQKRDTSSDPTYLKRDVSLDPSRLKRDTSSDLSRLKRDISSDPSNLKRDASPDPSHLKRDTSSNPSHLKRDVSPDPSNLKRDVSPDPSNLKRGISSDASHLKRDTSLDSSHLKRDISLDPSHLKRDTSLDPSHLKRDTSSDASHLRPAVSSDPSHRKRGLSPDSRNLFADSSRLKRGLFSFSSRSPQDLSRRSSRPPFDRSLVASHPEQGLFSASFRHPAGNPVPSSNHRRLDRSRKASSRKQDFAPDPRSNFQQISAPVPSHLKRQASTDASRLQQDLSSDTGHLRRDLSPDGSPRRWSLTSERGSVWKRDTSPGASLPDLRGGAAGRIFRARDVPSPSSSSSSSSSSLSSSSSSPSKRASSVKIRDVESAPWRDRRDYYFGPQNPFGYFTYDRYFPETDNLKVRRLKKDVEKEIDEIKVQTKYLRGMNFRCRTILSKLDDVASAVKDEKTSMEKDNEDGGSLKSFGQALKEVTDAVRLNTVLSARKSNTQPASTTRGSDGSAAMAQVQAQANASQQEIRQLHQDMNNLQKLTTELVRDSKWMREHLDIKASADADSKAVETKVENLSIRHATSKPAFSVRFTKGQGSLETAENGALKFTQVITNVGDGYSSTTGQFTAPFAGNYEFYLKVHAAGEPVKLGIYRSSNDSTSVVEVSGNDSSWLIINLTEREQVCVKETRGGSIASVKSLSFSGSYIDP